MLIVSKAPCHDSRGERAYVLRVEFYYWFAPVLNFICQEIALKFWTLVRLGYLARCYNHYFTWVRFESPVNNDVGSVNMLDWVASAVCDRNAAIETCDEAYDHREVFSDLNFDYAWLLPRLFGLELCELWAAFTMNYFDCWCCNGILKTWWLMILYSRPPITGSMICWSVTLCSILGLPADNWKSGPSGAKCDLR